jgi:hypothetical protein
VRRRNCIVRAPLRGRVEGSFWAVGLVHHHPGDGALSFGVWRFLFDRVEVLYLLNIVFLLNLVFKCNGCVADKKIYIIKLYNYH